MKVHFYKYSNGQITGAVVHGILGFFKGKVSAYLDVDGNLIDAEQLINNRVYPVKFGGPIWKQVEHKAKIYFQEEKKKILDKLR